MGSAIAPPHTAADTAFILTIYHLSPKQRQILLLIARRLARARLEYFAPPGPKRRHRHH